MSNTVLSTDQLKARGIVKRMNLQKRAGRVVLGSVVAVSAAIGVAACGGSSSGGSTSGSSSSPGLELTRAADNSSAAQGYKMTMSMHESVDGQTVNIGAAGSASPAKKQADMVMTMGGASTGGLGTLHMRFVLANNAIYIKLPSQLSSRIPGGKPWVSASFSQIGKVAHIPGYGSLMSSSSSFSNPAQYLGFLRATSKGSVKNLGQATVNGVQTTHYRADVDLAKVPQAAPAKERATMRKLIATLDKDGSFKELPINVWIDNQHLIRRLQLNMDTKLATGQSVKATIVENIHSYGPQPAPSVPSSSQTTNLLSLMGSGSSGGVS
jgi:hypothetical protein